MPRLKADFNDIQLDEDGLRKSVLDIMADDDAIQVVKAMARLMRSGDLGFWLSPSLLRRVKSFAAGLPGGGGQGSSGVDDSVFFSFLEQGGGAVPAMKWEVESQPDNGAIYRMLMKGGEDAKGVHDRES